MQSGGVNMDRILGMCERLMYFLGTNLCFLIGNIPVLLFFLFVGISQVRTYLPLFMLTMVFFGPALSATFYCMNRFMDKTESGVFKNFWHSYKSDWLQRFGLSAAQMLVILILWTNVEFFRYEIPFLPLSIFFLILFVIVLCLTPTLYLLSSRYQMKNLEILKSSVILFFTKPLTALGNVAALAVMLMFLEIQPGTAVLFIGSAFALLSSFMTRRYLTPLENQ